MAVRRSVFEVDGGRYLVSVLNNYELGIYWEARDEEDRPYWAPLDTEQRIRRFMTLYFWELIGEGGEREW